MKMKHLFLAAALLSPVSAFADHQPWPGHGGQFGSSRLEDLAQRFADATWELSDAAQHSGRGTVSFDAQELATESNQLVQLIDYNRPMYEITRHLDRIEWRIQK